MKIKIREIEVNNDEFLIRLKQLAVIYKENGYAGFGLKSINKEFGIKLTDSEFWTLMKDLKLEVFKGNVYFNQLV